MIRNIISKYKSVRLITVKMAMRTSDQDWQINFEVLTLGIHVQITLSILFFLMHTGRYWTPSKVFVNFRYPIDRSNAQVLLEATHVHLWILNNTKLHC
jgi:hypothetical protein